MGVPFLDYGERRARVDPTFDHVNVFQSIGESSYDAFTATFNKRMTSGWQHRPPTRSLTARTTRPSPAPTWSAAATIECPIHRISTAIRASRRSIRRTFVVSTVIAPTFSGDGFTTALLNNNQLGIIMQANSGLPFNIRSN
jgi:hypothetical protein